MDMLNSETKVQEKAMIIRQSSLRCKSKRTPSVIVAKKNDEDGTCASPIAVASTRMMVRANNKSLKNQKKKQQKINGSSTKVECLEKTIQSLQ